MWGRIRKRSCCQVRDRPVGDEGGKKQLKDDVRFPPPAKVSVFPILGFCHGLIGAPARICDLDLGLLD